MPKLPAAGVFFTSCLWAAPAFAGWFGDLYAGAAYTRRSDVTLVVRPPGLDFDHTFQEVKWDSSPEFGARLGYWFDALPWYGVGIDVFHFNADIPMQTVDSNIMGIGPTPATLQKIDISTTGFGLDLVRLRYRGERWEPYATAGAALFRVRAQNVGNGELTSDAATDRAWGVKLGAGLSWKMSRDVALFGEYRFTHVTAEPTLKGTITGASVPMHFDLNTHHVVAGVSLSF